MIIPSFFIIFALAVATSSVGFIKFTYFISVGYGGSVACMALGLLVLFKNNLTFDTIILCLLLIIYGCRLSAFTYLRQKNSTSYNEIIKKAYNTGEKTMPPSAVVGMWMFCSLLYFTQISPVFFILKNGKSDGLLTFLGVIIAAIGLYFEGMSDHQKSVAKKKDPYSFCDSGLFKLCRCANYFGEISFWTGIFVSGICAFNGPLQCLTSCIGYIGIVGIMLSSTRSLEARQHKSYGNDEKYQQYVKTTPILIPFVPIYSLVGDKPTEKEGETSKTK